jgi:hypothetical protein
MGGGCCSASLFSSVLVGVVGAEVSDSLDGSERFSGLLLYWLVSLASSKIVNTFSTLELSLLILCYEKLVMNK